LTSGLSNLSDGQETKGKEAAEEAEEEAYDRCTIDHIVYIHKGFIKA
jgi:hypothetical protein